MYFCMKYKLPNTYIAIGTLILKRIYFRQNREISDVQNALNSYNVVNSVLEHLNRPQDNVFRETLSTIASLLFNGNENIQVYILNDSIEPMFINPW